MMWWWLYSQPIILYQLLFIIFLHYLQKLFVTLTARMLVKIHIYLCTECSKIIVSYRLKRIWYDGGYIECIGIVVHKNWCCGDPAMCLCCNDCWSMCRLQQWSFQLSLAAHLTPVRQCVAHIMDYTPSDCDSNHFTPDCGILWFITPHQTISA